MNVVLVPYGFVRQLNDVDDDELKQDGIWHIGSPFSASQLFFPYGSRKQRILILRLFNRRESRVFRFRALTLSQCFHDQSEIVWLILDAIFLNSRSVS